MLYSGESQGTLGQLTDKITDQFVEITLLKYISPHLHGSVFRILIFKVDGETCNLGIIKPPFFSPFRVLLY